MATKHEADEDGPVTLADYHRFDADLLTILPPRRGIAQAKEASPAGDFAATLARRLHPLLFGEPPEQLSLGDSPPPPPAEGSGVFALWSHARYLHGRWSHLDNRAHFETMVLRRTGFQWRTACEEAHKEALAAYEALLREPAESMSDHLRYKRDRFFGRPIDFLRREYPKLAAIIDAETDRLEREKRERKAARSVRA